MHSSVHLGKPVIQTPKDIHSGRSCSYYSCIKPPQTSTAGPSYSTFHAICPTHLLTWQQSTIAQMKHMYICQAGQH
jgi:hypothetical protein